MLTISILSIVSNCSHVSFQELVALAEMFCISLSKDCLQRHNKEVILNILVLCLLLTDWRAMIRIELKEIFQIAHISFRNSKCWNVCLLREITRISTVWISFWTFSCIGIVALQSVNKIFPESYNFGASLQVSILSGLLSCACKLNCSFSSNSNKSTSVCMAIRWIWSLVARYGKAPDLKFRRGRGVQISVCLHVTFSPLLLHLMISCHRPVPESDTWSLWCNK
jgi:hypothetical protein